MDKQGKLTPIAKDGEFYTAEDKYIGGISADGTSHGEDEKLARDMVNAFNSQPALVEENKKLIEALEKIEGTTQCGDDCGSTCYCGEESCIDKLVEIARSALSAAREAK